MTEHRSPRLRELGRGRWQGAGLFTVVVQVALFVWGRSVFLEVPLPLERPRLAILLDLSSGASLRPIATEPEREEPLDVSPERKEKSPGPPSSREDLSSPSERVMKDPLEEQPPRFAETPRDLPRIASALEVPLDLPQVGPRPQRREPLPLPSTPGPAAPRANHAVPGLPALPSIGPTAKVPGRVTPGESPGLSPLPELGMPALPPAPSSFVVEGPASQRAVLRQVVPDFPGGVRVSARVRLRFVVRPDGSVGEVVPEQRVEPRLEAAAVEALRLWLFRPEAGRLDRGTITFVFELRG